MDFDKVHDGTFGMFGCHRGVTFVAVRHGCFQFTDAFIEMRILDFFLSHSSVAQRFFRVSDKGVRVPHATMLCRFFRVGDRFMNVRIPAGERRRDHQYERCHHQHSREYNVFHRSTSLLSKG